MRNELFNILKYFLILLVLATITDKIKSNDYSDIQNFSPKDTLFLIFTGNTYELGMPCGYINSKGDTVIPIGKYTHCLEDTLVTFGFVAQDGNFFAIDQHENIIFDMYWFDSGPDYVKDGLFRIIRNNKIGFANEKGKIIIEPQFECAFPFENDKAKVSYDCKLIAPEKEVGCKHNIMSSDSWFYIDKKGNHIYDYNDYVLLTGKVKKIKYIMPSRKKLTTFLLELDKSITVNSNDEWEGHSRVTEVHLNISNDKIDEYSNKTIQVFGKLFHALTIHHRRDICIKVEKIEFNE